MSGKKWSQKDIRRLVQQLSSWWLFNSMYMKPDVTLAHVWDTMPLEVRTKIVIGGLRGFQSMAAERADSSRKTSAHYAKNFPECEDVVDRFAKLAVEDDKAAAACQKLIDRVELDGLPPEVATWRPDR